MCNHPVPGGLNERERLAAALERAERLAGQACPDTLTIMGAARLHLATLPRPRRTVTITCYAVVDAEGSLIRSFEHPAAAEAMRRGIRDAHVVTLAGRYDE